MLYSYTMIIGVMSDTHDDVNSVDASFELFRENNIDLLIHCGDWKSESTYCYIINKAYKNNIPLYGVLGNRDSFDCIEFNFSPQVKIEKEFLEFDVDGVLYGVYHGHQKNFLKKCIDCQKYKAIFTGHTHAPELKMVGEITVINPGSTTFSIPRQRDFIGTIALYNTKENNVTILELK
jgi:uncharacterized protein